MSIKNFLSAVAVTGFLLVFAGSNVQAQGEFYDLYLRIDGENAIDNGNLDIPIMVPGSGSFDAQVILRETVGNGTPWLGNSNGLTSVNFLIDTAAPGTTDLRDEASPYGGAGDNSSPGRINGIGITGPSPQTMVAPGVFESLAGTFTFNFNEPQGQISLRDGSGGADFGVFVIDGPDVGPQNLDDMITFRTATITAAAVPEPGSFAVLGLGAVGMVIRRRRR